MSVNWVPSKPLPRPPVDRVPRTRPVRSRSAATLDLLMQRVRAEYREMPGLSLTRAQACCLWGVDGNVGEQVLRRLVQEGFLMPTAHGTFVRADGG